MRLTASIAKSGCCALVVALALTAASTAHATAFMEVVWVGTSNGSAAALASLGTNTIVAAPNDVVTAELRITTDALGLSGFWLSVAYDEDLEDELDFVSSDRESLLFDPVTLVALLPVAGGPALLLDESEPVGSASAPLGQAGLISPWELSSVAPTPGAFANTTLVIGTVTFTVTSNVVSDGPDVRLGKIIPGIDALLDSFGNPLSEEIPGSVELIPEPGTLPLIALGLAFLRRAAT